MCGTLLRGRKGTAFVSKDHIGIRGAVSVQLGEADGVEDHYFVTRNTHDEHHFCDWDCVRDFADNRRMIHDRRRERLLRDQAAGES